MERDPLKRVEEVQAAVPKEPSRAARIVVAAVRRLFELSPALAALVVGAVADDARAQSFDPNDSKPAGIPGVVLDDGMEAVEEDPFADDPDDPFTDKDPFGDGGEDPFGLPDNDPFEGRRPAPKPTPSPEPEPAPAPAPAPGAKVKPVAKPTPKPVVPALPVIRKGGETKNVPKVAPKDARLDGETSLGDEDVDRLYREIAPSTVRLGMKWQDSAGQVNWTSCTAYVIEPGVLATARHCISKRDDSGGSKRLMHIRAEWPESFDPATGEVSRIFATGAEPVGFSKDADTAFVVFPPNVQGPKPLATNGAVKKNRSVAILGHPQGLGWMIGTARINGVISGGSGRMSYSNTPGKGSSGGPVVDANGKVVGTNVYGDDEEGVGYAVPIAATLELLAAIKAKGWVEAAQRRLGNFELLSCDARKAHFDYDEARGPDGRSGQTVELVSASCRVSTNGTLSPQRIADLISNILGW